MGLLSYIEPIGAALSLARSIFQPSQPDPQPKAQTPAIAPQDFRAELNRHLAAADEKAQSALNRFDLNRDGVLTRTEVGLSEDAFAQLDGNGDGRLDVAELVRAYTRYQEPLR